MGDAAPVTILALDLATTSGFATRDPAGAIRSGVFKLPSTGDDIGRFLSKFHKWIVPFMELLGPQELVVAFEAPFVSGKTTQVVARKLFALAGHTEFVCTTLKVRKVFQCNNSSIRSHFIHKQRGKRAELKRMVIQECRNRGFDPTDDNEADALAVLDYACHCLRLPSLVPGGMFKEAIG